MLGAKTSFIHDPLYMVSSLFAGRLLETCRRVHFSLGVGCPKMALRSCDCGLIGRQLAGPTLPSGVMERRTCCCGFDTLLPQLDIVDAYLHNSRSRLDWRTSSDFSLMPIAKACKDAPLKDGTTSPDCFHPLLRVSRMTWSLYHISLSQFYS